MNKKIYDLLLSMSLIGTFDYMDDYIEDDLVNDCLMSMYFYMMCDSNNKDKDKYFIDFDTKYQKLNSEQQEIVKKDYFSIIDAQNKNKEKVKKKGMIDYE